MTRCALCVVRNERIKYAKRQTHNAKRGKLMVQDFKKLEIWQDAQEFALRIYSATNIFPGHEQFTLTSQLRRAALSISANIAEGSGRGSAKDFARFLYATYGSVKECESFILIAHELKYMDGTTFEMLNEYTDRLGRKISRFIESVSFPVYIGENQIQYAKRITQDAKP